MLRAAGRQRDVVEWAHRLHVTFTGEYLHQLPAVEQAMGRQTAALMMQLDAACRAADDLAEAAAAAFSQHPDAQILTSFPGIGPVTGAAPGAAFLGTGGKLSPWRNSRAPTQQFWPRPGEELRMEGPLMAILSHDGSLLRTLACPIPPDHRSRLRGARRGRSLPPHPGGPITVQRRVSSRGGLMVARQKIHAGMIHAGKVATVICENTHFRVVIDGETAAVVPRTTTSEVHRYKANATDRRTLTRPARKDNDPHA